MTSNLTPLQRDVTVEIARLVESKGLAIINRHQIEKLCAARGVDVNGLIVRLTASGILTHEMEPELYFPFPPKKREPRMVKSDFFFAPTAKLLSMLENGEESQGDNADTQRKIEVINQTKDPLTKALLVARLDGEAQGKTEFEIHAEFKKTYRRQLGSRDSDRERMFANKARNVRRRLGKLNGIE